VRGSAGTGHPPSRASRPRLVARPSTTCALPSPRPGRCSTRDIAVVGPAPCSFSRVVGDVTVGRERSKGSPEVCGDGVLEVLIQRGVAPPLDHLGEGSGLTLGVGALHEPVLEPSGSQGPTRPVVRWSGPVPRRDPRYRLPRSAWERPPRSKARVAGGPSTCRTCSCRRHHRRARPLPSRQRGSDRWTPACPHGSEDAQLWMFSGGRTSVADMLTAGVTPPLPRSEGSLMSMELRRVARRLHPRPARCPAEAITAMLALVQD
jgi:hypothetical protein